MEQVFPAPLHQGPSVTDKKMRCPNQRIGKPVVFVCDAMTNVLMPDNGAVRTAVTFTLLTKTCLKPHLI